MVRTPCFPCKGTGLIPGQGTKISHAVLCGQKILKKKKKKRHSVTGLSQRRPGSQNSRGRARLVLIFLLFLFRAPAAGKGQARGGGPPYHLPETALSSLLFAPASRPPSLFLHLLLPHLAPSGVLSCSPCFVSPPWESKGPWGQSQAPQ